ncbi:MAG: uracil-DNA glycosylase [Gammaproteobacteria bacterium]|nr:uracil-DNA glycosylase [Gammaproteobacteria bacterium]
MTTAARKSRYLAAMGIHRYVARGADVTVVDAGTSAVDTDTANATVETTAAVDELSALEVTVSGCRKCSLCETRRQTVFGVGNPAADCMLVGEAPGAEEDRQGKPFVGRAGQLLDAMLFAVGMNRDEVYIANVLKCRPPQNRDPQGEEVVRCEPYLHRQVDLVAPRLIVAMGRFAAQSLLRTTEAISRLRGREFTYRDTGIPLIVTYHPAYLLRNPADKSKAWDDLLLMQKKLAEAESA